MRKIVNFMWCWITAPFRLIFTPIIKVVKKIHHFLTFEPDEQPLEETLAVAVRTPSTLLEHVNALRKHIFRALVGLAITVLLSFFFTPQLVDFLSQPIGGIGALKAIDVTESVGVFMRVALLGGFTLASPYIAFEVWLFAAVGMKARSRRFGLLAIPLVVIFFVGGISFAYFVMLPTALPFLLTFMGITTIPRPSSYIGFVTGLMFWIGVAFEFPLVIYILTGMGLIKPKAFAQQWRLAIVLIALLAAAITPTVDPVNMSLVMAPMVLLYFLGIGLSYLAAARKNKPASSLSAEKRGKTNDQKK